MKQGILALWLLVNAVVLFVIFNPWWRDWAAQGIAVLFLEVVFLVIIGLPVFCHQFFRKKKPFRQSLAHSVESVLDILTGWA
jgi:hypothetical protein